MIFFKPRVGKEIFAQITGGFSVITPRFIYSLKVIYILFYFNISQVSLMSNWALNQPWVLEF